MWLGVRVGLGLGLTVDIQIGTICRSVDLLVKRIFVIVISM